jgi:hypothetical protein
MPAGVSTGQYLKFTFAALASMALGSQTVHVYFNPMKDFDKYVHHELNTFPEEVQKEIADKLAEENSALKSPHL